MTAHKNSGNALANNWRNTVLFYCLLLMMVSLFFSRAALSVSAILFITVALVQKSWLLALKRFFTTSYFVFFSLLFFIPFVSGLWSDNLDQWSNVVRVKLPLLFIPLAFVCNWQWPPKQWFIIAGLFLLLLFAGCTWGLLDYWQNSERILDEYRQAKTLQTPLEDDHVRYSWLVSVGIMLCLLLRKQLQQKAQKRLLGFLAFFFAVYLHILSARTGIVSLYLFLLIYGGWHLLRAKLKKWAIASLLLVITLPFLAYVFLPTFRTRLHYNLYDLSFVRKSEYLPGTSDGARVMSLKAGWQVLKQNPLGVGAGDVRTEADKWYEANVPQVLPADKFNPSSEWLLYGGFAGWPGVLLFTVVMALPFVYRTKKHSLFWIAFHATAAFSFLFDMGLEVQYGVFIYVFVTCWWWKWFGEFQESFPKFAAS